MTKHGLASLLGILASIPLSLREGLGDGNASLHQRNCPRPPQAKSPSPNPSLRGRGIRRLAFIGSLIIAPVTLAADQWVVYTGGSGSGSGKKIVLISGDEEYRSEETL